MVHFQRTALRIPLFFAAIVWAVLALSSAATAHGITADTGGLGINVYTDAIVVAGRLSDGEPSQGAPDARHATDHHCHGASAACHFYAASYAARRDWPHLKGSNARLHGSVLYSGRELTPLLRPPRGNRLPG